MLCLPMFLSPHNKLSFPVLYNPEPSRTIQNHPERSRTIQNVSILVLNKQIHIFCPIIYFTASTASTNLLYKYAVRLIDDHHVTYNTDKQNYRQTDRRKDDKHNYRQTGRWKNNKQNYRQTDSQTARRKDDKQNYRQIDRRTCT